MNLSRGSVKRMLDNDPVLYSRLLNSFDKYSQTEARPHTLCTLSVFVDDVPKTTTNLVVSGVTRLPPPPIQRFNSV